MIKEKEEDIARYHERMQTGTVNGIIESTCNHLYLSYGRNISHRIIEDIFFFFNYSVGCLCIWENSLSTFLSF